MGKQKENIMGLTIRRGNDRGSNNNNPTHMDSRTNNNINKRRISGKTKMDRIASRDDNRDGKI